MKPSACSEPVILDSITHLLPVHAGRIVIAASHGGRYSAFCAGQGGVRAVIFNDAGVGCQQAGIAGLDDLKTWRIPAAAVDYQSCRIGDGQSMAQHGRLSHANALAQALGCLPGMTVRDAAQCLRQAHTAPVSVPAMPESRQTLLAATADAPAVIGVDSVSLVRSHDDDQIVVTASHGQCLAGVAHDGVRACPRLVTFHDAGIGQDGAGTSRLASLQRRGVAALTVAAHSARIGDARSCYETGQVSCANAQALALGCQPGMLLQDFLHALLNHHDTVKECVFHDR